MSKGDSRFRMTTFCLILTLVTIFITWFFVYKLYNEKVELKQQLANISSGTNTSTNIPNITSNIDDLTKSWANEIDASDLNTINLAYDQYIKNDTDISKIKAARLGAQHAGLYFFVIKKDGIVKLLDFSNSYEVFEPLKDYKVVDIVNLERKEDYYTFKMTVELLDGSTKEVEFQVS